MPQGLFRHHQDRDGAVHITLNDWLQAFYLMASSKKGVSAHQLHRTLGITYEAAWFMAHRIREAMRAWGPEPDGRLAARPLKRTKLSSARMRSLEGPQEAPALPVHKNIVLTLVERGGSARSFHIDAHSMAEITRSSAPTSAAKPRSMTDEGSSYNEIGASISPATTP